MFQSCFNQHVQQVDHENTNINDAKPPGSFLGQGQGGPRLRVAKEAWLGETVEKPWKIGNSWILHGEISWILHSLFMEKSWKVQVHGQFMDYIVIELDIMTIEYYIVI